MYAKQNQNTAVIERKLWKDSTTPRMRIVKQLLNKLLEELEIVNETERANFSRDFNLPERVKNYEIDIIRHALYMTNNNQRRAAQLLGIKGTTLNAKMKRHGI
ncbi:MAG: helix-turn-helix domain-containing protein [Acidobacteriota bacterium]